MARSVRCVQCGSGVPLPEDLRTPSFTCPFCQAELSTAQYAGEVAVSADHLRGYMDDVLAGEKPLGAPAPRFVDTNTAMHADVCKRCGAAVAVPLALELHFFTCAGCGTEQRVVDYVSDKVRLDLDMERQLAGNQALRDLRADGLACKSCGGQNAVPDDGSIQIVCRFCGQPILLTEYVDEGALSRARMRHAVDEMKEQMRAAQEEDLRRNRAIGIFVAVIAVIAIVVTSLVQK